ncbi:MAG: chorismate mutase [Bacillota bacterium]|nr:chorismate mutase [Bacillota bacterium]
MEAERKMLDSLDDQIAQLFCQRMEVIDRIARIKFEQRSSVYRPEREKQVTDRLLLQNGDKYEKELRALYGVIFEQSRDRQEKLMKALEGKI